MIGQSFVQRVSYEPADREIDLGLSHQPTVMYDPEQKSGEHQPNRDLGIDPRPSVRLAVEFSHLRPQPRQIENAIHPGENMIVGHELPQRPRHEQFQLI